MLPICDYHMHTPLCGHAVGEPAQYAQHAVDIGLEEIGFSDHAPMVNGEAPGITMKPHELPGYLRMIEEVRQKFQSRLRIKVAIEADFIPGYEKETRKILDSYPFDYVIGSVHFIKDWGFDNPEERDRWEERHIDLVYRDYYDLLRQAARSKLFDYMAHVDLVKKFGHRPHADFAEEIRKTAAVFKETGMVIEINTSGLRKPVREMYPALPALKMYAQAGVPLTFGSDAHDPHDVGRDFDKAVELAKAAGYKEYVLFKQRKIERIAKL